MTWRSGFLDDFGRRQLMVEREALRRCLDWLLEAACSGCSTEVLVWRMDSFFQHLEDHTLWEQELLRP